VDGATVSAQVLRQERGEKIVVFKYKPKARTRVKQGHRAELTTLRIADIAFGGKSAAKDARQADSKKDKAQREAEQQAEQQAAADRELAAKLAAAAPVEETAGSTPKRTSKTKGTVPAAEQAESTGTKSADVGTGESQETAQAVEGAGARTAAKAKPAKAAEEAEGEQAIETVSTSADADQPAVETDSEIAPTENAPAADPRKDE
jgi:hypothetical protein